jgi:hypothetical protein
LGYFFGGGLGIYFYGSYSSPSKIHFFFIGSYTAFDYFYGRIILYALGFYALFPPPNILPKTPPKNPDDPSFLPLAPSKPIAGSFSLEDDLTISDDTLRVVAGASYYFWSIDLGSDVTLGDCLVDLIWVIILPTASWRMGSAAYWLMELMIKSSSKVAIEERTVSNESVIFFC